MNSQMKLVTLCALVTLLIQQSSCYSKKRQRSSSIPLRIKTRKQCFSNRRVENLIQSIRGTHMCRYRGRNYKVMESIFDEHTCRACICHAPDRIYCCQAELVPDVMPFRCTVDPADRLSQVPRMGKCMAPLITKGTIGKHPRPCMDRQLLDKLRRSKLWLRPGSFGENRIIWAHPSRKSNSRRHSGTKGDAIFYDALRRILDMSIYHLPISEESK